MRGFLIFLIMLIGIGLVLRTTLEFQKQRRFTFKNAAIMKKQQLSMVIGVIGVVILLVTVLAIIF